MKSNRNNNNNQHFVKIISFNFFVISDVTEHATFQVHVFLILWKKRANFADIINTGFQAKAYFSYLTLFC